MFSKFVAQYDGPVTADILTGVARALEALPEESNDQQQQFTSTEVSKSLRQFSKSVGMKFPVLMKCLRSILSGLEDGPPVGEMIQLLGKDQTLKRIKFAQEFLEEKDSSRNKGIKC